MSASDAGPPPQENRDTRVKTRKIFHRSIMEAEVITARVLHGSMRAG
jgi:hypothetical protein